MAPAMSKSEPTPSLPEAAAAPGGAPEHTPRRRSWVREFLFAPFEDIDERVRVKR